ncbi:uncharacterized protein [Pseudorasbora parva]|uniref:uncharacterized protein n=1 Tax=Pseudorasbora parva TaxID=51549 RepID=UPI00351F27DD
MVSMCRQILGMSLGIIGFIGAIVICALPMWKVTAFIGANIVTAQTIWEGLWMNCVVQSTGQMQCKIYDSLLALPQDLQAARALVVIAIIVCVFGIILGIAGGKCTSFVEREDTKVKVAIASGVIFIVAGVLILVPVCWSANTIIRDFYNPILTDPQRREIGGSLYIGWGAAALLILGGGILCSSCPPKEDNYGIKYSQPRSVATSKAYPTQTSVHPQRKVNETVNLLRMVDGEYLLLDAVSQPMQEHVPLEERTLPTQHSPGKQENMVSMCRQTLGMSLGIIGFIGTIVICALPMWKVTAFIGSNIVTAQIFWEGLWMNCVVQSTGQMQCKIYDSLLALPQDLQAARALVIIAIIVCVFGIILGIAGGKCTSFVEGESTKVKVAIASGVIFLIAGVLVLVPICWSANTIIRDFYNPILTDSQRREIGASLYIGFGAAALLILGGGIMCSSCPPKEDNYGAKYSQPRSVATSKAYV